MRGRRIDRSSPDRRCVALGALMFGVACVGLMVPARAGDTTTPLAFVTAIYGAYKGKDSVGIPLDGAKTIRRYFEPQLAAVMIKDQSAAARRGDVGALDFDPFIDAQDWDMTNFDIAVNETAPNKATATVKFVNQGDPTTVVLDLVAVNSDWRINDIAWQVKGKTETLRKLYTH
jgi:Protein of unknown function (DUF3828)